MIFDEENYTVTLELQDVTKMFFVINDEKFTDYTFIVKNLLCPTGTEIKYHKNDNLQILDKGIAVKGIHENIKKIFDEYYASYFFKVYQANDVTKLVIIDGSPNPEHDLPVIKFSKQNYYKFKLGMEL